LYLFKEQNKLIQEKNVLYIILLLLTIIGAIAIFFNNLTKYSFLIFFLGIPLTIINGTCEEIFWRGIYIRIFKNSIILSIVYPTIMFAIWHISSELVNLNMKIIEILPFILLTLPLGLIYSFVAFRTKSIKWVAIAHSLSGIFAFGVPLSTSLANIIGIPFK
jgi:membrane protease YdiL (CAAX protease family)